MLHALYEQGVVADLMVATSLGALNAAFVASRPQTSATARALARAWNAMDRSELFPVSMRALVGGITGQRDHLVSASGLRQVIQRNVQLADLADAEIPVCLLSFDLNLGSEVTISRGPAVDAILAACSTPGIFAPVLSGDRLLVEAATTGAPIARAVELGAERVYVLTGSTRSSTPSAPRTALDAILRTVDLLAGTRLMEEISTHASSVKVVELPAGEVPNVQPTAFKHARAIVAAAFAASREALGPLADDHQSGPRSVPHRDLATAA